MPGSGCSPRLPGGPLQLASPPSLLLRLMRDLSIAERKAGKTGVTWGASAGQVSANDLGCEEKQSHQAATWASEREQVRSLSHCVALHRISTPETTAGAEGWRGVHRTGGRGGGSAELLDPWPTAAGPVGGAGRAARALVSGQHSRAECPGGFFGALCPPASASWSLCSREPWGPPCPSPFTEQARLVESQRTLQVELRPAGPVPRVQVLAGSGWFWLGPGSGLPQPCAALRLTLTCTVSKSNANRSPHLHVPVCSALLLKCHFHQGSLRCPGALQRWRAGRGELGPEVPLPPLPADSRRF